MKLAIISLGCPKNQADADVFTHALLKAGHETVADPAEADAILINTCGMPILPLTQVLVSLSADADAQAVEKAVEAALPTALVVNRRAHQSTASAQSNAEVRVWVTDRLEARTSTGAVLRYRGEPAIIRTALKFMGGEIKPLE